MLIPYAPALPVSRTRSRCSGWHLEGKQRQPEHRDANGVEDLGAGVAALHEGRVDLVGALELLEPREQDATVIADHGDEAGVVADAELSRFREMLEGRGVVPELELAQPPERPGRPVFWLLLDHVCEGVPAFAVPVGVVVDSAETPVAFRPGRLQCDCPLVQLDRFVNVARSSGVVCLATQRIESRLSQARRRRCGHRD